jgi:FAD:protein FMN transferase
VARAVMAGGQDGGGVLVSLGGDIATGGVPPRGGWPITAADGPAPASGPGQAGPAASQVVRLPGGAVATSSVTVRQWRNGGRRVHHIVDPATGRPADGPWRTVSVGAATCADANAAATAAIVAGPQAVPWLAATGLPARLVSRDGDVRRLGGWPAADGGLVPATHGSRVYAGVATAGGPR